MVNNPPKLEPAQPVIPPASSSAEDFDKEVARFSAALVSASADARAGILAQLRDSKGGVYTEALARTAGKMTGEAQRETRFALAKRLTRMTANTVREMLKDPNRELRCGAATACASSERPPARSSSARRIETSCASSFTRVVRPESRTA